jgi:hypothetical protein
LDKAAEKRKSISHPLGSLARAHRVHREGEEKASILFALRGRKKDRWLHREARMKSPRESNRHSGLDPESMPFLSSSPRTALSGALFPDFTD